MRAPISRNISMKTQVTRTAATGLSPTVPRATKAKKGPNKMSLATASMTLLAPIRLLRLALKVAN